MVSFQRIGLLAVGLLGALETGALRVKLSKQSVAPTIAERLHPAVVHFMFELRDGLAHADIWSEFFGPAHTGSFMIWAHCTDRHACENDYLMKLLNFRIVPTVFSSRGADLITPFVQMMRVAMRETSHLAAAGVMEKFAVISDTTLPVKPFSAVYRDLTMSPDSDFCVSTPKQWAHATIDGEHLALVKHHQWVVLNRTHAERLESDWRPTKQILAYNLPLKTGKWAGSNTTVSRSLFKEGSWYTATDEEAVYAKLFGPVLVPRETIGNSKWWDQSMLWSLFRNRRCSTYVAFPNDVHGIVENVPPAVSLLQASRDELTQVIRNGVTFESPVNSPASLLQLSDPGRYDPMHLTLTVLRDANSNATVAHGIWHPFMMNKVGDEPLRAFRQSPYLFARKFSPCARMPNYSLIMFAE